MVPGPLTRAMSLVSLELVKSEAFCGVDLCAVPVPKLDELFTTDALNAGVQG